MKIWIFGASNCLPWRISKSDFWGEYLRKYFDAPVVNMAAEACDNLFIYHNIIQSLDQINSEDIVLVGWSHPNRKTFVFDDHNPVHASVIKERSIVYPGNPMFFRSNNINTSDSWKKWLSFSPQNQGIDFFDRWFSDYFSPYESRLNLQSYIDSTRLNLRECRYHPFYFSKESVSGLQRVDVDSLFYLDFVLENSVTISNDDAHANEDGHKKISKFFINALTST